MSDITVQIYIFRMPNINEAGTRFYHIPALIKLQLQLFNYRN